MHIPLIRADLCHLGELLEGFSIGKVDELPLLWTIFHFPLLHLPKPILHLPLRFQNFLLELNSDNSWGGHFPNKFTIAFILTLILSLISLTICSFAKVVESTISRAGKL
jgi:hypothetical protein